MATDTEILARIDAAFAPAPKPAHFCDPAHCPECADHDATLRANTRESIGLAELGNPGWDPLCFASAEGLLYYAPALARLALRDTPPTSEADWYGPQLAFHLSYAGTANRLLCAASAMQRRALAALLAHLIETRAGLIDTWACADEFLEAWGLWACATSPNRHRRSL